jgi:hypothetical protein
MYASSDSPVAAMLTATLPGVLGYASSNTAARGAR